MAKSEFRCNLEHAVRSVPNCAHLADANHIFVDRRKTGDRIKFAFKKCTAEQAREIESIVDDMYPDSEVKVESQYDAHMARRDRIGYYYGWYGVTIKVSHDKGIML